MKLLIKILITVFITICFYSCSEDTINNTETGPFTLNGTIENWTYGGNIMLKAELYDTTYHQKLVLDSNIIGSGGAFSVKLRNVPVNLLYTINFVSDSEYIANVTVNPPNTKSNWCSILTHPIGCAPVGISLSLYNSNDSIPIGFIYRGGTVNISRWFSGFYLYFDQDVIISGTMILNYPPYDDTTFYDLSGKQGWNEVVVLFDSLNNSTFRATISASEPPGGKWRAYIPSDALYGKSVLRKDLFKLSNSYNNK